MRRWGDELKQTPVTACSDRGFVLSGGCAAHPDVARLLVLLGFLVCGLQLAALDMIEGIIAVCQRCAAMGPLSPGVAA